MSDVLKTAGTDVTAEEPAANRYALDAQERINILRSITDFLDDQDDGRPLTAAEMRLAGLTTPAAMEKAALFSDAVPTVANGIVSSTEVRDTISYELAYQGVIDELLAAARRGRLKILRRKLKITRDIRVLYRMAKGYVTSDAGDGVRTYVEEMKRTLVRPRRKKAAAPPEEEAEVKK